MHDEVAKLFIPRRDGAGAKKDSDKVRLFCDSDWLEYRDLDTPYSDNVAGKKRGQHMTVRQYLRDFMKKDRAIIGKRTHSGGD